MYLFFWLHSVWQTLGLPTSLQMTQTFLFFLLSNILFFIVYHIFFIHSSVDGHLGCFHVLDIVHSAAMNIRVYVPFSILVSSRYIQEKEMATYSSILAWRIPGTEEPGGLPSRGSHRVGHNWSNLAAAAVQFSCSVMSDSLWPHACQRSLSITSSQSLLRLMSIELVMPSNHFILCHPLLLSSIFPSIRVFSNESVLCIRWPKYWSFSFSICPSNDHYIYYYGQESLRKKME